MARFVTMIIITIILPNLSAIIPATGIEIPKINTITIDIVVIISAVFGTTIGKYCFIKIIAI